MFKGNKGRGQFILKRKSSAPSAVMDCSVKISNDYTLWYNKPLQILPVVDGSRKKYGYIIGYPIDIQQAELLDERVDLDIPVHQSSSVEAFEDELYKLGGRFVALQISTDGTLKRLYPDAGGALSCLYSRAKNTVASTIEIAEGINKKQVKEIESEWSERWLSARGRTGNWYPAGLSPIGDWRIVLPNHHINFETREMPRHWPRPGETVSSLSPFDGGSRVNNSNTKRIVSEVASIIESQVCALQKREDIRMDLTAGKDSRSLLATAKPFLEKICLSVGSSSKLDVLIPTIMSRILDLPFKVNRPPDPKSVRLTGFAGEVGRAYYWNKKQNRVTPNTPVSSINPLERIGYRRQDDNDKLEQTIQSWFSAIPASLDAPTVLDLLYIEQRVGTTFSQVLYRSDTNYKFSLYPYNHRRIYSLMMKLPPNYRIASQLPKDIINLKWSESGYFQFTFRKHKKKDLSLICDFLRGKKTFGDKYKNTIFVLWLLIPQYIKILIAKKLKKYYDG